MGIPEWTDSRSGIRICSPVDRKPLGCYVVGWLAGSLVRWFVGWVVGPVANVTSTNAAIGSYVLVLYFSGSQKKTNDLWPFRCACKKKVVSILGIAI